MPKYEFKCSECGKVYTIQLNFKQAEVNGIPTEMICPDCYINGASEPTAKRVWNTFTFRFEKGVE